MRSVAVGAFALALAVFAALVAVPFLSEKRDFPAAVTSPPALVTVALAELKPGQRLCMRDVTIEPRSESARMKVGTYSKPGPALTLELSGPGYRQTARLPGGYPDNLVQSFAVNPPERAMLVRACLRNEGRTRIALYAAADRARSRAFVTVDGREIKMTPQFSFWEGQPRSLAERAPLVAQRVATFRGPLGYTWVVWAAAIAATLGLTAGLGLGLWQALGRRSP